MFAAFHSLEVATSVDRFGRVDHCIVGTLFVCWHELDLIAVSGSVGNKGLYTRVNPSLNKDYRNMKKKFRNVQFFKVVIELHLNHFAPLRHTPKF